MDENSQVISGVQKEVNYWEEDRDRERSDERERERLRETGSRGQVSQARMGPQAAGGKYSHL